jgi:hypothetical protein
MLITAVTSLVVDYRAAAQSKTDAYGSKGEPMTLQWKFAKGETLYYEQTDERVVRDSLDGQHVDIIERRYYLYRWDVIAEDWPLSPDGVPMSSLAVSFGRIVHESDAPGATFLEDTFKPSQGNRLNAEAKDLQNRVFRMLQSSFVFFATSTGATGLPNDLAGIEIPRELQVPEAIESPRSFTAGDVVGFPDTPLSVGDSWSIPVSYKEVSGTSRFRLIGESQRDGRKCMLIEGETTFDTFPALLNSESIAGASIVSGTSTWCFDAERGRLIDGEERIKMNVHLEDGATRNATLRVNRHLIEQPEEPEPIEVTRQVAGGEVLNFWYRAGNPLSVQGELADVFSSGLLLLLAVNDEGRPEPKKLSWNVVLKPNDNQEIAGITVRDVTGDEPVLLLEQNNPKISDGLLVLNVKEIDVSESVPPWLIHDEIRERIFEIRLWDDQGESTTIHQPVLIHLATVREQIEQLELMRH